MSAPIPSNFRVFITNINTAFGAAYADTLDSVWPQFASMVPVTGSIFTAGWTGMMPKMRPWFGARVVHEPAPQTYSATPVPYEITYDIDRFHLDDDLFGIYYRMIPDMARQTARWPNYELRDLLENAGVYGNTTAQAGFDGLPYFSTAHPIDIYNAALGTYINDFTAGGQSVAYPKVGGGTTSVLVGGAFGPTAFATLYEYMETLLGEDGERLGVQPNFLMHPLQLTTEVELVLKNTFFAPPAWGTITGQVGAADNVFRRFGVMPVCNPFLTSSTIWYLGDGSKAYRPLTWAVREAVRIVPRMNEDDPVVFDTHKYLIGGWGRAVAAWNYSWLMARSGS